MCVICRNEYHGKEKIDCEECTSLTQIPNIPGLKRLECGGCTSLTHIPVIPGLKVLWCSWCTSLTNIPVIPGLEVLDCYGCTNLTHIPVIPGLKRLECGGCTSLTHIPVIPGLEELYCGGCTSLTHIPVIPGLKELWCYNCPWIKQQNDSFQSNMFCLIKLQRWVKKYLPFRRLKRWIETEEFAMWYYHPENPGGLRQKAKMMKMFGEIRNKIEKIKTTTGKTSTWPL